MKSKKSQKITPPSGQRQTLPAIKAIDNQNSGKIAGIAELLQHNYLLQAAFNAITDPVAIIDLDFKLVAVNKAFAAAVKMEPENITGRKCYEIIHRATHPVKNCPHAQALQTKKAVISDIFEPHLGTYFQFTASPVFNESGELTGTIHLMKNIAGYKQTEEELRKSNQRYRNLVEATTDFIWETDTEGVYTYASPKIFDLLGYKAEEMMGKTPFNLMPPEEAERTIKIFNEYVSRRSPINALENINYHKDGHPVVLETSGVPFYDSEGSFQGYRGIDRDITQRKKMEEALRKSEERLRQYFQLGLVGMAIESPTGEWVEVNDRLCEIYGYTREELMQLHWKDLTHPDDLEKDVAKFEHLLQGKINHYRVEKRYIRKDGEIVHAIMSAGCTRDQSGEISSIFVLVVNITEQKKVEAALAEAKDELEIKVQERTEELKLSEEKYHFLVENANEAIIVARDGRLKFFNQREIELTGYSREELAAMPYINMVHPDDRELITKSYQAGIKGENSPSRFDVRIIRKNGDIKWLEVGMALITWEGQPALLGMLTDITERKLMERDLKDNAQKITRVQEEERKRIAYELHDDTAQYLSILKLQLDSLIHSGKIQSPEVLEKLQYLERDAGRAVDDVRRFSHELRPAVLDRLGLQAALEQVAEDINKLKQITVELTAEGEEPDLSGELKLAIFRIAQEALNNARKHAGATKASVKILTQENRVRIEIRDNGTGFDIQEARVRAGNRGSLGLMSMRERARLIGADLNIISEPGKGTTVTAEVKL